MGRRASGVEHTSAAVASMKGTLERFRTTVQFRHRLAAGGPPAAAINYITVLLAHLGRSVLQSVPVRSNR